MDVRLGLAVCYLPEDPVRRAYTNGLVRRLGGLKKIRAHPNVASFDLVPDTGCTPAFGPQREHRTCWPNTRKCQLRGLRPGVTHVLAMMDDMWPYGPSFLDALAAALQALEDHGLKQIVSIFAMRQAIQIALDQGSHWVNTTEGSWGGSTVFPADVLSDFLYWERRSIDPAYKHDDGRFGMYAHAAKVDIWNTAPCLIQHVGAAESTIGQANYKRVAKVLMTGDAAEIDWHKGLPNPPTVRGSYDTKGDFRRRAALPGVEWPGVFKDGD